MFFDSPRDYYGYIGYETSWTIGNRWSELSWFRGIRFSLPWKMKEIERKLEYRVNSFINIPRLIEYHLLTRLATRNSRVNNPSTRESTKKRCWIANFANLLNWQQTFNRFSCVLYLPTSSCNAITIHGDQLNKKNKGILSLFQKKNRNRRHNFPTQGSLVQARWWPVIIPSSTNRSFKLSLSRFHGSPSDKRIPFLLRYVDFPPSLVIYKHDIRIIEISFHRGATRW